MRMLRTHVLAAVALTAAGALGAQPLFTEVTATHLPSGIAGACMNADAGDADGDGDLDLALAMEYDPKILLLNDGSARFSNASARLPRTIHDSEDVVFADFDARLPLLTRGLIALSDFLREYGLGILVLLAIGLLAFAWAMRSDDFRRRVHHLMLRLPFIGRLTRGNNMARFTRTLGILFGSGVPILDAMRIGAQVVSNLPMREAIEQATLRVREGASVNRSLAESGLFPPITLHLIASGEASGRLDEMLDRAAEQQERDVETLAGALMAALGPALVVLMGGMVFLIVMAVLLPIFDLNTLLK